ncbi:MAG TPA: SGNH/GDSL hydrolase family protein [Elusimicrobiota bacterium]|nr:SGNH/GDSL hydrolase family protein [Elusimicrobiota bacterium]
MRLIPKKLLITLTRFSLVVGGLIIAVIAIEYSSRPFLSRYSLDRYRIPDAKSPVSCRPSDILPYEYTPNNPEETNSLGMRDKEYSVKKPAGVKRIIFLGDSITAISRYTDMLEERLQEEFPGRYEVLNFAVAGYSLSEYAILTQKRILRFQPDYVVLGLCLNDSGSTWIVYYDEGGELNFYKALSTRYTPLSGWLYKHSNLYRYLNTLFQRLSPSVENNELVLSGKSMSVIRQTLADRNIPLRALLFTHLMSDERWTPNLKREYYKMTRLLKENQIPYLDMKTVFPSDERVRFRNTPDDICHFNGQGDLLVTEAVYRYLKREGFY